MYQNVTFRLITKSMSNPGTISIISGNYSLHLESGASPKFASYGLRFMQGFIPRTLVFKIMEDGDPEACFRDGEETLPEISNFQLCWFTCNPSYYWIILVILERETEEHRCPLFSESLCYTTYSYKAPILVREWLFSKKWKSSAISLLFLPLNRSLPPSHLTLNVHLFQRAISSSLIKIGILD